MGPLTLGQKKAALFAGIFVVILILVTIYTKVGPSPCPDDERPSFLSALGNGFQMGILGVLSGLVAVFGLNKINASAGTIGGLPMPLS